MPKVHIVDGTYEIFRAFYGAPARYNCNQEPIAAARTFIRSLQKFIRNENIQYLGIAFDTVIESFRNEMFSGYKTGEGIDEELWLQHGFVQDICKAAGIRIWCMRKYEADDAIAAAAKHLAQDARVDEVLICSPDKDFAQCVNAKVKLWDRKNEKLYDSDLIFEKFGVYPESIPDYLGLVGDAADGIPGIAGFGKKSVSTLLAAYKHIENIPATASEWKVKVRGAAKLAERLVDEMPAALLYRDLATLRTDLDIPMNLEDLSDPELVLSPQWIERLEL
jgi:5'-3' exonuclease